LHQSESSDCETDSSGNRNDNIQFRQNSDPEVYVYENIDRTDINPVIDDSGVLHYYNEISDSYPQAAQIQQHSTPVQHNSQDIDQNLAAETIKDTKPFDTSRDSLNIYLNHPNNFPASEHNN
jgi:hypothetical protein